MVYWKSLVNLQEIKKPNGKFLRVWAKNQLRCGTFDNFLDLHKNISMET